VIRLPFIFAITATAGLGNRGRELGICQWQHGLNGWHYRQHAKDTTSALKTARPALV
jgi:hypothetical protein